MAPAVKAPFHHFINQDQCALYFQTLSLHRPLLSLPPQLFHTWSCPTAFTSCLRLLSHSFSSLSHPIFDSLVSLLRSPLSRPSLQSPIHRQPRGPCHYHCITHSSFTLALAQRPLHATQYACLLSRETVDGNDKGLKTAEPKHDLLDKKK